MEITNTQRKKIVTKAIVISKGMVRLAKAVPTQLSVIKAGVGISLYFLFTYDFILLFFQYITSIHIFIGKDFFGSGRELNQLFTIIPPLFS